MHKALVGGAAALLLSATAASAATVVTLDGFCNAYAIRKTADGYAMKDTGCSAGFGAGYLATVKGDGKTLVIGLQDPATSQTQFVFKFSYPLTTGGTWSLADTTDGVHVLTIANGTYSLPTAAEHGLPGPKSVTSK